MLIKAITSRYKRNYIESYGIEPLAETADGTGYYILNTKLKDVLDRFYIEKEAIPNKPW